MKKIIKLFLWLFFPAGILYCIGHCLFKGDLANFMGAIFICGIGILLGMWFIQPTIYDGIISFVVNLIK